MTLSATLTPEQLKARFDAFIAEGMASRPNERKIISKLYTACKKAGNPIVSVWDSEEDNPIQSRQDLFDQVFNLDEATLCTQSGAMIWVVMGEDLDTISDYNVSLEETIKPVNDWIMKKMDEE